MAASRQASAKRNTLKLRITAELRGLIDQAAGLAGKNRTDFVLDAARHIAEDALLDQTVFLADPGACKAFVVLLDAPPCPNDRFRRALRTAAPWDK